MQNQDLLKELENKKFNKPHTTAIIVAIVLSVVMIFSSVWLIFAFIFPANLGRFMYNLNINSYALKLYERDYKKDGNLDSLYMSLNISIKIKNDRKIVELYEIFSVHDEYWDYISCVDKANLESDAEPLIKSTLINEDNYLKNQYLKSLIRLNYLEKAVKYAFKTPLKTNPTYLDMGNYLLGSLCNTDTLKLQIDNIHIYDCFRDILWSENTVYTDMYNYMMAVSMEFWKCFDEELYPEYQKVSNTFIYAMGNRIIEVGSNILNVCNILNVEEENGVAIVENTRNLISQINEQFKYL